MLRRAIATAACCLALGVPAASAHSGVPKAWWLEEGAAVTSLRDALEPRYRAVVLRTFRGSCNGLGDLDAVRHLRVTELDRT